MSTLLFFILTFIYYLLCCVDLFYLTNDALQPDGCKLSVLLTFHINSTPIWCLGNFVSRESSIDYTVLGI